MDLLSCVKESNGTPTIISLRNGSTTQYGLSFEGRLLWIPMQDDALGTVLQAWAHVHEVLNLAVDQNFSDLWYFLVSHIAQIVPLKQAKSLALQQFVDQINNLN